MPRIRNWENLEMCRPYRNSHYDHAEPFIDTIYAFWDPTLPAGCGLD
jgi:hypothetical protein